MKKVCALQVLIDCFIYLMGLAGLYGLWVYIEPLPSGFFCDDARLKLPHKQLSTVPYQYLLAAVVGIPLLSILIIEPIALKVFNGRCSCGTYCSSFCKVFGTFMFGGLGTMLVTEVGKIATGRLRPDFFDLCRPDMTKINCAAGYVIKYNCTNTENDAPWELVDVHKAFPSGHASMAAYTACFLMFYYQSRCRWQCSVFLKTSLQLAVIGGALFAGLSRISDHKHHPEDVIVGFLIGALIGLWIVYSNERHLKFFSLKKVSIWTTQRPRHAEDDGKGMHMPLYTR